MKFICLKYLDKNKWHAISESDRQAFIKESFTFDAGLRESGHSFACATAQTVGTPIGLHSAHGQLVVEDDLHAHSNEWLGGLMFLEARDLNHAIILVSNHPGIRVGWFKIHPAHDKEEMQ